MNVLRGAVIGVLMLAVQALALDKVPAIMVSTSTNTYNVLTGKTAQADFDFIDDWMVWYSNTVAGVSNLAQDAYDLANASNAATSARIYSYANTGTFTVATCTGGQAWCYVSTQDIGRMHAGLYVTGSVFNLATTIDSVDYDTRRINLSLVARSNGTAAVCSFWGGGTYTHVVPTNFSRAKVIVTGGGAGGGAASDKGGCGGAGGTSIGYWNFAAGASYTVTVGNGTTGVVNGATAATAGTSSFGSLQTATGGTGGTDNLGGLGGSASGGSVNFGGGSAGLNRCAGVSYWGGAGGPGILTTTTDAKGFGSGGGGGDSDETPDKGGAGRFGIVVVEYY